MYKAINKNSKQIHKATEAIKSTEDKTEKMLNQILEQQNKIAKQQQESFMELLSRFLQETKTMKAVQDETKNQDFSKGVSKPEKPSSSSRKQEESAPLKKKNTSNNQRSSPRRTSQSLVNSTSKSINPRKERQGNKKNSTVIVETTSSLPQVPQQNLDLSKLQSLVDKIADQLPQALGPKSQDTKQSSTQQ